MRVKSFLMPHELYEREGGGHADAPPIAFITATPLRCPTSPLGSRALWRPPPPCLSRSVVALPAAPFLLLAARCVDTDASCRRLLVDHWLMVTPLWDPPAPM